MCPEDEATQALVLAAQSAVNDGDYPRADQLLKEAEAAELGAMRLAEELERQAQDAAKRRRRSAAAILAERGELGLARLDYLQAAEHFKAASELVGSSHLATRVDYLNRFANALLRHGIGKDSAVLQESITVYRGILNDVPRAQLPQDWAMTQNNLGAALQEQGTRTGGEDGQRLLGEAVKAYRNALEVRTRAQLPQQWATTQNNLGSTLSDLGVLEHRAERFKEAKIAFETVYRFYQEHEISRYDDYFEEKLRSLEAQIAEVSGSNVPE